MEYTWYNFCKVEEHFREKIAEISHDKLNATDIFIVNGEKNCANPNKTKEVIDVWFVALGSDAKTIQIGNDLKDSRQLSKLGSNFETKVMLLCKFFVWRIHSQAYKAGGSEGNYPPKILENQRNWG